MGRGAPATDRQPGARHGLQDQGLLPYDAVRSLWLGDVPARDLERTVNMGKDAAAIRNELQPRLAQIARELGRQMYPDGLRRGTKFSELETLAGALGDEIARQLIQAQVQEQANDWPEEQLGECPVCGGPARKAPDEPRELQTTRGGVAWTERVRNCPRCRRAFFPSEPGAGPRSHRAQPARPAEDRPRWGQ